MRVRGNDFVSALCFKADLAERLAEREEMLSRPLSLDNVLTGTPPPGRSALDGWQQRGIPEREWPRTLREAAAK